MKLKTSLKINKLNPEDLKRIKIINRLNNEKNNYKTHFFFFFLHNLNIFFY